jgi:hypothetical protein
MKGGRGLGFGGRWGTGLFLGLQERICPCMIVLYLCPILFCLVVVCLELLLPCC